MSRQHFIVVEGKEDREFVLNLRTKLNLPHRTVYAASDMQNGFSHPKCNRKKVEEIASLSVEYGTSDRLTCLVDREFREFNLQRCSDKIGLHHVVNNTYWTLGHSFENYFFDPTLLVKGFSCLTTAHWHASADQYFSSHFDFFSTIAASLSIADFEVEKSGFSIGLRPEIFKLFKEINGATPSLDTAYLDQFINDRLDPKRASRHLTSFKRSLAAMKNTIPSEVRKFIRGHTGIVIFQASYAWCLAFTAPKTCDQNDIGSKVNEVLQASSESIFKQLLRSYLIILDNTPCRLQFSAYPRQFFLR
ncbi:DUF4435 domain-containing protein [Nitrosomonas sp. Nm33]|uniref:DUF4435 domain-containing protein n=1 Tax=Nitrosomonas sp. Nm33 TaxID=133724 RepID=UPI00159F8EE3|nr:DUF4435 domain-containing protein [Nitrosomonas sp. Nm33]